MNTDRAWAEVKSKPYWYRRAMVEVFRELVRQAGDAMDVLKQMHNEDAKARVQAGAKRRADAAELLLAILDEEQRAVEALTGLPPRPDKGP